MDAGFTPGRCWPMVGRGSSGSTRIRAMQCRSPVEMARQDETSLPLCLLTDALSHSYATLRASVTSVWYRSPRFPLRFLNPWPSPRSLTTADSSMEDWHGPLGEGVAFLHRHAVQPTGTLAVPPDSRQTHPTNSCVIGQLRNGGHLAPRTRRNGGSHVRDLPGQIRDVPACAE